MPWSPNVSSQTGGNLPSVDPSDPTEVFSIAATGSNIYVGVSFLKANFTYAQDFNGAYYETGSGTPQNNVAAFTSTSGALTAWDPNADAPVRSLVPLGSAIYAADDFATVNGKIGRTSLAAFNATTGSATGWDPEPDDFAQTLATDGSLIYAGGYFTTVKSGMITRRGIAAFDSSGTATAFDPNIAVDSVRGVLGLNVAGQILYAVGEFNGDNAVNGNIHRNFAAAFSLGAGSATGWNSGSRCAGQLYHGLWGCQLSWRRL